MSEFPRLLPDEYDPEKQAVIATGADELTDSLTDARELFTTQLKWHNSDNNENHEHFSPLKVVSSKAVKGRHNHHHHQQYHLAYSLEIAHVETLASILFLW